MPVDSSTPQPLQHTGRRVAKLVATWGLFGLLFLWGWRVRDVFHNIPGYEDTLEVLWGTLWYHQSLFVTHQSPLFTGLVFHPGGWHTATLAHTPTFFLLTLPLYFIGGAPFAYNLLVILSTIVALAGALRFARLFAPRLPATIGALIFTFMALRWLRISVGHVHMLWASALLPWLLWGLETIRRTDPSRTSKREIWLTGIIWGVMINFSLYSVFMGGVAFVMWGKQLFSLQRIKQAAKMTGIALALGAPVMILYLVGIRQDQTTSLGLDHLLRWGSSLNSLAIPSVYHPFDFIQRGARSVYSGPYDESGVANLGTVTWVLGIIGLAFAIIRRKEKSSSLIWIMSIGLLLCLGLVLKWNGDVVSGSLFRPANSLIWKLGHLIKPHLFVASSPQPPFDSGLPLPSLLLTALVPYWDAARTVNRFALLGGLGLIVLAAQGLQRFPRTAQYLLAAIWLVEVLPMPTGNYPMPERPHPAYEWLAQQDLGDQGIVDLLYPTIYIRGETLFATWFHRTPTAAGVGSFWPQHTLFLWQLFVEYPQVLSNPDVQIILGQYEVRYLFLHLKGANEHDMWDAVSNNPAFRPVDCFAPLDGPSPWAYPICVAEVVPSESPIRVIRQEGWSGLEEWGVWAQADRSQALWLATSQTDHTLSIEAFPLCLPDRQQDMSITVNGTPLSSYRWQACESWSQQIVVPAAAVTPGWNTLTFDYGYAASSEGDPRPLAVGFTRLEVAQP